MVFSRGRRRSRALFGCLTFLLVSAASAAASATPPRESEPEPVRFVVRGGPGCPTEDEFLARARQAAPELVRASGFTPARTFVVTFAERPGGRRSGELRVEKDGAVVGSRAVEAGSCAEVARVLAFAVALAYHGSDLAPTRPSTVAPGPAPGPSPGLATAGAGTVAPPRPAAPVPPPRPIPAPIARARSRSAPAPIALPETPAAPPSGAAWWAVAAHGAVASDLAPSPTFGAGLSADVGGTIRGVEPFLHASVDYGASASAPKAGGEVAFRSALLTLEGCLTLWTPAVLAFSGCAHIEGGARVMTGEGITGGHTVVRPWLALGPAPRVRVRLVGPWFVDLAGALFFTAIQDEVALSPPVAVYAVKLVGGRGEIGVGLQFR